MKRNTYVGDSHNFQKYLDPKTFYLFLSPNKINVNY